jgi:transcriptional regulator with XRE-family HTH domain
VLACQSCFIRGKNIIDEKVQGPAGAIDESLSPQAPERQEWSMHGRILTHDEEHGAASAPQEARVVRLEDLGELIRAKRKANGLTLEQAARQTGVSPATLSRLERQSSGAAQNGAKKTLSMPDTRTLAAVAQWLDIALDRVVEMNTPAPVHGVTHYESDTVPDIVAAHLRADPKLNRETAEALVRTFRVAYEQFAQLSTASDQGSARATKTDGGTD